MKWSYSVLTVALVLACDVGPDSPTWQARRTALGDTTIVHTLAGQTWSTQVEWREDVAIGLLDGPPQLTFGRITRLAEDNQGGIYVLDGQAPAIRHYDRAGEFLRAVGNAGDGPGEYGPLSLGMVVDSTGILYVHDWGNQRVVRFDGNDRALDPWALNSPFLTTRRGRWIFADRSGRLLVAARVEESPALLVIKGGQPVDTVMVPRLPGLPAKRGGPYGVDRYWSWHPDGCLVVGVSSEYSLDVRCSGGVRRIRRDVVPQPVHAEEAESYRRLFEWMDQQPAYRPPEGEWIPATMPPFSGLEVGTDGRIWVRRNTEPVRVSVDESPDGRPTVEWTQPFVYDVFEADGTFLGEVQFPNRFDPHLFGTRYVWGVRRGNLDEEYVVRLSMVTRE